MKIGYFANGQRGLVCLEEMIRSDFTPSVVVLHPENKSKNIYRLAKEKGVQVLSPRNVNSSNFLKEISSIDFDLFVLSGYGKILKERLLSIPKFGTINLHGGTLPKYRGGSPINWQIINGEDWITCTILYADAGIDTGDIIGEEILPVGSNESAGEVIEKTLRIFPRLLVKVLKRFEKGKVQGNPQDINAGTYFCKRFPEDGKIDWERLTDVEVHNLVRALRGETLPGAFSFLGGEEVKILKTSLLESDYKGVPGRVAAKRKEGVVVIAANRGVVVEQVSFSLPSCSEPAVNIPNIVGKTFR